MIEASTYALRLPHSVKRAVAEAAQKDGTSINQFIAVAVSEKLAVMATARFFEERAQRANIDDFRQILERVGGELPRSGDEMTE